MLFVNPAQERFGGMLWRYIAVGIPIAIGVLSAYLKKFGVKNIKVIDEEIEQITEENLPRFLEGLNKTIFDFLAVPAEKAVDRIIRFLNGNGKTLYYTPLSAVFYYAVSILLIFFPFLYSGSSKK